MLDLPQRVKLRWKNGRQQFSVGKKLLESLALHFISTTVTA